MATRLELEVGTDYLLLEDGVSALLLEAEVLVYPTDAMARVSSIRHLFRPGMYRMEIRLGDIGFDARELETAEVVVSRRKGTAADIMDVEDMTRQVRQKQEAYAQKMYGPKLSELIQGPLPSELLPKPEPSIKLESPLRGLMKRLWQKYGRK